MTFALVSLGISIIALVVSLIDGIYARRVLREVERSVE